MVLGGLEGAAAESLARRGSTDLATASAEAEACGARLDGPGHGLGGTELATASAERRRWGEVGNDAGGGCRLRHACAEVARVGRENSTVGEPGAC